MSRGVPTDYTKLSEAIAAVNALDLSSSSSDEGAVPVVDGVFQPPKPKPKPKPEPMSRVRGVTPDGRPDVDSLFRDTVGSGGASSARSLNNGGGGAGTGYYGATPRSKPNIANTSVNPPANHALAAPLLLRLAAAMVTGYAMGMGVGFLRAGINLETFFNGALLQDSAIGAVVAGGTSLTVWMANWLWMTCNACGVEKKKINSYQVLDSTGSSIDLETALPRSWYRPSPTEFYPWEVRLFLSAMGAAVVGSVISTVQLEDKPIVNGMAGHGIGAIVGAVAGFLYQPKMMKYFARKLTPRDIPERNLFDESRHDVPWYTRVFFGAWIGYIATMILFDQTRHQKDFDYHRLVGTALTASIALVSPVLFAMKRLVLRRLLKMATGRFGNQNYLDFSKVSLMNRSQMDFPWYAKAAVGFIFASILTARFDLAYPGRQMSRPGFQMLASFMPFIFDFLIDAYKTISNKCCKGVEVSMDGRMYPALPNLLFDTPWYFRLAFGSATGAMFSSAIHFLRDDPMAYPPPDHSQFNFIFTAAFAGAAFITPFFCYVGLRLLKKCTPGLLPKSIHKLDAGQVIPDKKADLTLPWYARTTAGAWGGLVLGVSLSQLCHWGDPTKVAAGIIGPEFLNISNAVGAPEGVIAGAVVGFAWPLIGGLMGLMRSRLVSCWAKGSYPTVTKDARIFSLCRNGSSSSVGAAPGSEMDFLTRSNVV